MEIEKKIKSHFFLTKKDIRLDNFIKIALFNKNGYYYNKKPIGKKNDFFKTNFLHEVQMLDMKQCKKLSSYLHKNLIYKKNDTDFSFFSCLIGE